MNRPEPRTRRLFFAFWPDAATREAMAHASRKAVRGSGGRPVRVENLHMTLAFLGSVAADRFDAVRGAAAGLGAGPLRFQFDGIEFWPRPQVLVAVASRPAPAAEELGRELWRRLAGLGFEPEVRPFRPHVTLARKVRKPAPGLGLQQPVDWPAPDLALVESVTDPDGSRYTVLERWPLAPGSSPEPPPAQYCSQA